MFLLRPILSWPVTPMGMTWIFLPDSRNVWMSRSMILRISILFWGSFFWARLNVLSFSNLFKTSLCGQNNAPRAERHDVAFASEVGRFRASMAQFAAALLPRRRVYRYPKENDTGNFSFFTFPVNRWANWWGNRWTNR